jgi:DNA-binding response OmpR family regulator
LDPVLVVDDDPLFRELIATILRRAGYRPVEAATGEEALVLAERERPTVVVLDVHLPGISGHEVCIELGRNGDRPPVLFVSGERIEAYDRVAGLLVGGDDYLVKPFAPDELLARVRALIRRVHERRRPQLTTDERDLIRLLRDGVGAAEVAQRLGENERLVRERLGRALTKLGV